MNNKWFVLDAETDGIYGKVLSVAAKVINSFKEEDYFYASLNIEKEDLSSEWVEDNVYDTLKNAEIMYDTEEELLEAFWAFYLKYHGDYEVLTDVPYPVETGVFGKCIAKDRENREKYSPSPIYDLESMLVSNGYDKLAARNEIVKTDLKAHDAMNDVDITIKILEEVIMEKTVYSYHTFFFPFVWNVGESLIFDDYINELSSCKWEDISIDGFDTINDGTELGMNAEQKYQFIQYFTEAAREAIIGWNKQFVRCFAYDQKNVHENAVYHIEKEEETAEKDGSKRKVQYTYNLIINGIKLKVFNTGIAVFSIEAENYDYRTIDDVKRINEYGRRIFAPYFLIKDDKSMDCDSCADVLGINYNMRTSYSFIAKERPKTEEACVPPFIRELLPAFQLKPAIDDRMFVACCVCDKEYALYSKKYQKLSAVVSGEIKDTPEDKAEKDKNYRSERDEIIECAKSLYELFYIDRPHGCSCQSLRMMHELLSKTVYDRWGNYGTFTGITHHSMVCINDGGAPHVIFTFIAIYTHMVSMVLAQRAAIIVFDEISSRLTSGFRERKVNMRKKKRIEAVIKFQEKYIAFCNQHNNIEITCQEQGVEIYNMLQEAMYVKENNDKLEKEVNILYETANASNDLNLNVWALWFAIAAIVLAVVQIVVDIVLH